MFTRKPYFKDAALQQQYERDGYVIVDNVLSKTKIEELAKLFKTVEPPGLDRMYCNIYDRNAEENEKIDKTLVNAFSGKFDEIFSDCRMTNGVFLVKGTGQNTASVMHQDWSSVDESKYDSLAIWCPLTDVDESNGCIYVVKGSHRIFNTIRSLTIPKLYLEFNPELEPFLTPVPVKAGQVLIYAHQLFHGSKPKLSGEPRVAVVIGVIPNDARMIYFFRDQTRPDTLELYETNTDFYFNGISKYYDQQRPVGLPKTGELRGIKYMITREEFFETMRNLKPSGN